VTDIEILQAVADRQTITEIIYRHCRSMDRIDVELGYSLWHEDAVVDYGGYYRGPAHDFIDLVCAERWQMQAHSHQVSNVIIELDSDRAGSETCLTTNLRIVKDEKIKQITQWARYIDQWSRRDGRWAIDKRIAIRDFDKVRNVVRLSPSETEGHRDHRDPSYSVLRNLPWPYQRLLQSQ